MRRIPILPKRTLDGPSKVRKYGPAVIEAVKNGVPIYRACKNIDLSPVVISYWKRRYKELKLLTEVLSEDTYEKFLKTNTNQHDKDIIWFFKTLESAENSFIESSVKRINSIAKGGQKIIEKKSIFIKKDDKKVLKEQTIIKKTSVPQWTASAWLLERRFPEDFGRNRIAEDESANEVAEELNDIIKSPI